MRVSSSGGHGSTANENMAGMGNRWSGLANPINTVGHEHTSGNTKKFQSGNNFEFA
jgi:hypothetical protein